MRACEVRKAACGGCGSGERGDARGRFLYLHAARALLLISLSSPFPSFSDMSTYHELVKKAAGSYREMFVV